MLCRYQPDIDRHSIYNCFLEFPEFQNEGKSSQWAESFVFNERQKCCISGRDGDEEKLVGVEQGEIRIMIDDIHTI